MKLVDIDYEVVTEDNGNEDTSCLQMTKQTSRSGFSIIAEREKGMLTSSIFNRQIEKIPIKTS